MPVNRPLPPLPPRPVRDLPARPTPASEPTPVAEVPGATPLPEGVSRDMIVALARELAAEMARSARPAPAARPLNDARPARSDARQSKPDARPMRFVYGAGAVAAMSVMAVGLVQPDFAATADQSAGSGPTADPNPVAQVPGTTVQHVTQYIQLKPGQTAPPGATVIAANAPTPRVVVTHNTPSGPAAQPAARPPAPKPATRQSGRPRP